jgi:hypothetical protein
MVASPARMLAVGAENEEGTTVASRNPQAATASAPATTILFMGIERMEPSFRLAKLCGLGSSRPLDRHWNPSA